MKQWIAWLMVVALLLTALPAFAQEPSLLEQNAARLATGMPQMATNEAYLKTLGVTLTEDVQDALAVYGTGTWQEPLLTVWLGYDADMLNVLSSSYGMDVDSLVALMPDLVALLGSRMIVAEDVMVASALLNSIGYVDPTQPDGTMIFLRIYADGAPLIYRVTANDGAVWMTCGAVCSADLLATCRTLEDVEGWLRYMNPPIVTVHAEPVLLPDSGAGLTGENLLMQVAQLADMSLGKWQDPGYLMVMGTNEVDLPAERVPVGDLRMAVRVELDVGTHAAPLLGLEAVEAMKTGGEPVARRFRQMLPAAWASALVAQRSMLALSMMNATTAWSIVPAADGGEAACVYLLFYGDADVVSVACVAENGVATLQAQYLLLPELALCQNAAEVALWLAECAVPAVCTEVALP